MRKTSLLLLLLPLLLLTSCKESKQKIIEKAKIGYSECVYAIFPRPTDVKVEDYEIVHVDDSLCIMNTHVMYRYDKGKMFKFVMLKYKGEWYGNIEYIEQDAKNKELACLPYSVSLVSMLWETRYTDFEFSGEKRL